MAGWSWRWPATSASLRAGAASGLPEVRLAVTPGAGGTQRLPRVVGVGAAKELTLTGRILDAHEAERIGLVSRVVPAGQAVARGADEIGAEIAQRGPLAVREVKRLIDLSARHRPSTPASRPRSTRRKESSTAEDMLEGARAFFEKRPPNYRGEM